MSDINWGLIAGVVLGFVVGASYVHLSGAQPVPVKVYVTEGTPEEWITTIGACSNVEIVRTTRLCIDTFTRRRMAGLPASICLPTP